MGLLGPGHDREGDRVLAALLDGGCCREGGLLREPTPHLDAAQPQASGRHRAGLVEHDRVDAAGVLQHLGPFDEGAQLCAAAGAHEQGRRGGETQRAGAGDDQHRDRHGERLRQVVPGGEPGDEGDQRDHEHRRHEHRGDPVGESLHLGLAGLGVLDESLDAGEHRLGAHPRGLDDESAVDVDRPTCDGVAWGDVDGCRLARHQAGVDRALTVTDDTVAGHLLTGPHDEAVADDEVADGNAGLAGDSGRRVDPQHGDVLSAEVEQGTKGVLAGVLGPGLEEAAGEQKGRDDGGHLEVEVRAAGEQ